MSRFLHLDRIATRAFAIIALSVLGLASAQAQTVLYDNVPTGAETVSTTGGAPRTGGADEVFFAGDSALITQMALGYAVATGGPSAFDVRVQMWDNIDAVTATGPQFNTLVGDFTVAFTGQTAGAFISAPINLATLPGGGVNVTSSAFTGAGLIDVYVQLTFLQSGTLTPVLNNSVTYIFDGSGPNTGFTFGSPELGGTFADELYWRDANGDGIITADEGRTFATPLRANMVLQLSGTLNNPVTVPEGNSLVLLGLGLAPVTGIVIARRRKKA